MRERASGNATDNRLPDDDLIEIHDPEIDPAQLMAEIRQRIEQRRQQAGYTPQRFPTFGGTTYPGRPLDIPYDPTLYHALELLNKSYAEAPTEAVVVPSPATRVPLLGNLWQLIRTQAHGLVLFYVNRAVKHELNVNRQIVSTLNLLTATVQEQQREIMALQAELEALYSRLDKQAS
jgi:uncharacterized coiled-coil protein SlyX